MLQFNLFSLQVNTLLSDPHIPYVCPLPCRVQVNMVLSEPYFSSSTLPWHSIYFWYARTEAIQHMAPGARVLPGGATIMAVTVEFADLWKIRAPVGLCEGFDITTFDDLIEVILQGIWSTSNFLACPTPGIFNFVWFADNHSLLC